MATLADLEANYAWQLERYLASPKNTPEQRRLMAQRQILIDEQRKTEKKPLRWYTSAELDGLDEDALYWPAEPREPLALTLTEDKKEAPKKLPTPKMVNWDAYTTITLDSLLEILQEMRKTKSGDTPVMGVEFGGYSGLSDVIAEEDCIVIE